MTLKSFIEWWHENKDRVSPGPWEMRESADERPYIFQKSEKKDFDPLIKTYRNGKPGKANAELILQSRNAMPELVEALEAARRIILSDDDDYSVVHDLLKWAIKYFPDSEEV